MESALLLFQCYMCTCTFEWETCIPLLRLHGLITVKQNSLACQEQTDNIDCAITSVLFLLSYFLNSSQSFSNACGCVSFSVILSYWRSLMFKQCCCFHLYLSKSSSACLLTVDLCRISLLANVLFFLCMRLLCCVFILTLSTYCLPLLKMALCISSCL